VHPQRPGAHRFRTVCIYVAHVCGSVLFIITHLYKNGYLHSLNPIMVRRRMRDQQTGVVQMSGYLTHTVLLPVLKDCVADYADRVSLFLEKVPQTWLFLEAVHGILANGTPEQPLATTDLIAISPLLPSYDEWGVVGLEIGIVPTSDKGREHSWRWYRLKYLLQEYIQCYQMNRICIESVVGLDVRGVGLRSRFRRCV
jgi:hypothetical protein